MAFQFRHFKQILESWLSYVTGQSELTDVNIGSVLRTLGEATSLEVAKAYVEMRSILDLFSIDSASGDDLDERAADFGITRYPATKSTGVVTIGDSDLGPGDVAVSTLAAPALLGAVTLQVQVGDYATFPATGSVVVDRGTVSRELVAYTSKTAPDLLNLSAGTVFAHAATASVYLSTVGSDRVISSGTALLTNDATPIEFSTTASATLLDGDYQVTNVPVQSNETGAANNVAAGKITAFNSAPFPTATVNNPSPLIDGSDYESDPELRARIKREQQMLSSSTAYKIQESALQVVLPSGQRVVTAKVIEPITEGVSNLYINDGTITYAPTTVNVVATEIVVAAAFPGQLRFGLLNWPISPSSEVLYASLDRGTSTSVGTGTLTDTLKSWTVNAWTGFLLKDVNGTFFPIASNTADTLTVTGGDPAGGGYALFDPTGTLYSAGGSKLVAGVDYVINTTTGQAQLDALVFPAGLQAYDSILAYFDTPTPAYTYYDGLYQEVQKVINGDPDDFVTYPGVKAAGSTVYIAPVTVQSITVSLSIFGAAGVDETTLYSAVANAVLQYINNLSIGADVFVSRIIEAALGVTGVSDVQVNLPVSNVVIADTQLAKTDLSLIEVN